MTDAALLVARQLVEPLVDPNERLFLPYLATAAVIAMVLARTRHVAWRWTASCGVDAQLWMIQRLLPLLWGGAEIAGALALGRAVVRFAHASFGEPAIAAVPVAWMATYTVVSFIAHDLSRFLLHRALHASPTLWAFHQVHHSADALTPLTFHRVHPIESVLYAIRGAVVSGVIAGVAFWAASGQVQLAEILGVNAIAFVLQALSGNLRHSPVTWSWGDRIERWWLSPAQHQVHHGIGTDHTNFGTWLATWDRLAGSLRLSSEGLPTEYGLSASERNHAPDVLSSALVDPCRAAVRPMLRKLAACGALFSGVASAEEPVDDADDTIIVTSDRDDVPQTAGSAYLISEKELKRQAYTDVHRVLAKVPGVYLRDEDGFGLRPNIGIRGANSDRSAKVALHEDGVLLTPAPYSAPAAYYFPMMPRIIGVEVLKGPAAISQGPNTVGGAINLRTRAVPTDGWTAGTDLAGGSFVARKAHGYFGATGAHWGFLVEAAHLGNEGFKRLDGGGDTGFEKSEAMAKVRWRDAADSPTHAVELKLGASFERSSETYLGLTDADFAADPYRRYVASALDEMRFHREQAELAWTLVPSPAVSVRTVAYAHTLDRAWTKLNRFTDAPALGDLLAAGDTGQEAVLLAILRGDEDSSTPAEHLQIGTNDRRYLAAGVQSRLVWHQDFGAIHQRFEAGLRAHTDAIERLHTEDGYAMRNGELERDETPTATTLENRGSATALSTYLLDSLEWRQLKVLPGVRVEAIRTALDDRSTLDLDQRDLRIVALPGLAADYAPFDALNLFAGVHRGFTPVSPGEPPETRPELSTNAELGIRYTNSRYRAELAGFSNAYANLTGQCTLSGGCDADQVDRQYNGGRAWIAGIEGVLGATIPLGRDIELGSDLSYGLTHTRFQTGFTSDFPQFRTVSIGDALPYVPLHQGAARVRVTHERAEVSAAFDARSAMRDVAGQGPIPDAERIPSSGLVDLAARWSPHPRWSIYATAQNVANQSVIASRQPFGARPVAPRTVLLGVRSEFGARTPR